MLNITRESFIAVRPIAKISAISSSCQLDANLRLVCAHREVAPRSKDQVEVRLVHFRSVFGPNLDQIWTIHCDISEQQDMTRNSREGILIADAWFRAIWLCN
jgi:hypothetical protein